MPLRDHFDGLRSQELRWSSFYRTWTCTLVRQLNGPVLPVRYRAIPDLLSEEEVTDELFFGSDASQDLSAAEVAWFPTPTRTCLTSIPSRDRFAVRVLDRSSGSRAVAVIELVSPRNKDRPDARRDFVVKCASYLQEQVSVIVVDIVTDRQFDLYEDLLTLLDVPRETGWPGDPPLYAVAMRMAKPGELWQFDAWEEALAIGSALPKLPLWLASDLAITVDLESSYEETCRVLRIA